MLEQLSINAAATPITSGGNQRNEALIAIANAQIKLNDRAGARRTVNRMIPPPLPSLDLKSDSNAWSHLTHVLGLAEIRHRAGDTEGARARFRDVARLIESATPAEDRKGVAQLERVLNDLVRESAREAGRTSGR